MKKGIILTLLLLLVAIPFVSAESTGLFLNLNEQAIVELGGEEYILEIVGGSSECIEYEQGFVEVQFDIDSPILDVRDDYIFHEDIVEENVTVYLGGIIPISVEDLFLVDIPYEAASIKLNVDGSTFYVNDGESVLVQTIYGDLEVELEDFDTGRCLERSDDPSVILEVNGERRTIREGDDRSFGDLEVYVEDLFMTEIPTLSVSAELELSVEAEAMTMYLDEGWNLVPVGDALELNFNVDIDDIMEAAYVWSPEEQKYYDLFTEEGDDMLDWLEDNAGFTSVWIYLSEEAKVTVEYDMEDIMYVVENIDYEISEGWNFMVVLPQMYQGYPGGYLDIGSNQILDGGLYDWEGNGWEYGNYYDVFVEADAHPDYMIEELTEILGMPFIAYYDNEAQMTFVESTIVSVVPDFPLI